MERIRIVLIGGSNEVTAYNIAGNLNSIQKEFEFSVHKEILSLPRVINARQPVPLDILEKLGKKIVSAKYPDEFPVVLCDCELQGDLFLSHVNDVAVITTHGWTPKFSPYSVQRYIVCMLAGVLMGLYADSQTHYTTIGCIGDYCDNKEDINISLAKCDYCSDCQAMILKDVAKGAITVSQLAAIYKLLDFAAERRTCFVLMPFAPTFTPVYKRAIVPTLTGLKWICKRADEILKPSEIIVLIWQEILRADLIIADLTGRNPNVFYELGYAHALHKNTILITQSINDVPFDLRHRQMIQYSASPKGYADLTKTLTKYL